MWEVLVVVAGALLGAAVGARRTGRRRAGPAAAGVLAIALLVGLASGEFRESPLFLLVDTAGALVGAVIGWRVRLLMATRDRATG